MPSQIFSASGSLKLHHFVMKEVNTQKFLVRSKARKHQDQAFRATVKPTSIAGPRCLTAWALGSLGGGPLFLVALFSLSEVRGHVSPSCSLVLSLHLLLVGPPVMLSRVELCGWMDTR